MTYKEAKELYDTAKDEKALKALIEFFEYHNNNKNVLYYIADCFNELQRFSDGLNYVLSKVDNDIFPFERYSAIIQKLFKGLLITMTDKETNKPINKQEYEQELCKIKQLWLKFKDVKFLSMYGFECRNVDDQQEYLKLLENIENDSVLSNIYIKKAQLWCYYDLYIKNFAVTQETTNEQVSEFIKCAEFVTTNCCQEKLDKYYNNPYVLTIVKVVKTLNQISSSKYKEIIKWISLLDVDKLPPDDEIQYTNSFGMECESASTREFYYYQITRAYEKIKEYEKCIEICDKALSEDIKFHYRNKLWIKARTLYCECQIAKDKEKAILNYKKFVDKNDFWFMKHNLASVYFINNKMQEALTYNYLALDLKQEDKKLINVIYDLVYIFEALGEYSKSKKCLMEYIKIRNNNGWDLSLDVEAKAKLYGVNADLKGKTNIVGIKKLCTCNNYHNTSCDKKFKGTVKSFTQNGFSGFIETQDKKLVFFNKSEAKNTELEIGDNIEFELGKNKKGPIAIKIHLKEK